MVLRFLRFLGWLLVGGLILTAAAQDNPNPLLDMLKLVPDTPETRTGIPLISYADYRAVEAARGVPIPTRQDFDDQTDVMSLWLAAMNGVSSGLPLADFLTQLEEMPPVVGFSWFEIDRALVFGQPPTQGQILQGDFDAESIALAFEKRNYTSETQDDVTIWCGPNGCESGHQFNVRNRNPANPFGGRLGREEPLAVLPGYLANAPDYTVLTNMVAAYTGAQPSLADDPYLQAVAAAIARKGTLRQVQILRGAGVGPALDLLTTIPPDDESKALPFYSLAFFADTWQGSEQIALVGLVYDSADWAKTAADQLALNLQTAYSLAFVRPFMDLITERAGQVAGTAVEKDAATNKFVVILEIRYPQPSNEREDVGLPKPGYGASGLVFRVLINAVYQRDLYWLRSDFGGQ